MKKDPKKKSSVKKLQPGFSPKPAPRRPTRLVTLTENNPYPSPSPEPTSPSASPP